MKTVRWIAAVTLAVGVLAAIAYAFLPSRIESLIASSIEDYATAAADLTYGEATDRILSAIFVAARQALIARVGEAATDAVERELQESLGDRVREPILRR